VAVFEGLGDFLIGEHSAPSFARLVFHLDFPSGEFTFAKGEPAAFLGFPFVRFPDGGEDAPVPTVRTRLEVLTMIDSKNYDARTNTQQWQTTTTKTPTAMQA